MARQMPKRVRKAVFLAAAGKMYDALEEWYDAHPEATYDEIEQEVRCHRRELMGETMEILINGRDTGAKPAGVLCSRCGDEMEFKGYLPWTVHGLEGDVRLERAYYVCPECKGETIFPPGPETEVAL